MKLIGIDVDALRKRYAELEQEMAQVQQILAIAETTSFGPGVTVTERTRKTREVNNTGIRRICLLHLFTGPASIQEVARASNQEFNLVKSCLRSCVIVGLAYNVTSERFALTAKGQSMAEWHQKNPQYVTYQGGSV